MNKINFDVLDLRPIPSVLTKEQQENYERDEREAIQSELPLEEREDRNRS